MPRLTITAGFEMGTGIYINVTPPEMAAAHLREVNVGAGQAR
jgi:UDPglucose--hexose-1-phosphate uridylyltransferase